MIAWVEPVAGFPSGTESTWSELEQRELVDFLRDARDTKAKFLLTSRRDERVWLGDDLPRRIPGARNVVPHIIGMSGMRTARQAAGRNRSKKPWRWRVVHQ